MDDIKLLNSLTQEHFGDFNDIEFTNRGDLTVVQDHPKAQQSVVKILLTRLGSSDLFPGYGAELQNFINTQSTDTDIEDKIKNTIFTSLAYLNTVDETTTASERVQEIDGIQLQFVTTPLRGFVVTLVITLQDGTKLTINLGGGS